MEHDVDRPPDPPPDPGPTPIPPSPLLFPETPQKSSRKRPHEEPITDSGKRVITDPEIASASIQSMYTHPSLNENNKRYELQDVGPFIVHVSRLESSPSQGTSLKAIKFGQFLHKNKIANITRDGVKVVGRNRVAVEFCTAADANKFMQDPLLNENGYKVGIPTYSITRMGVCKDVPRDLSMDEFVNSLDLPQGCGHVLRARRFSRKNKDSDGKVSWIPTQTVVITFRGQVLPEKIYSYKATVIVEPYKFPTIQCRACCRFGHVKAQCRSKPRCYRCAQPHDGENCTISQENASCLHCSGRHFSTNLNCPEHSRQKFVKLIMSQDNISFSEANAKVPSSRKPYAEVAKSPSSTQNSPSASPPSQTTSYRKTVFTQRRPHAPLGKSYDKQAHNSLIADVSSSLPNGCALNNNSPSSSISTSTLPITPNDNLLEVLISSIICIVSKFNDTTLPPNVANKLKLLYHFTNGSDTNPSVECPESES